MAKQGWISLHRSIQDNWIWKDEPFDKRSAWVDILLMANHQDNKFLLGSELINVEAGSFITSEKKLSERWEWGRTKVRNFLKLLENDEMILKITDTKKTTIKVINYKQYQRFEGHEEIAKNQPTNNGQTTENERIIPNYNKQEKTNLEYLENDNENSKNGTNRQTTEKPHITNELSQFSKSEFATKNQPTNNERTGDEQGANNGRTTDVQRANTNNNDNNANTVNNENTVNKKPSGFSVIIDSYTVDAELRKTILDFVEMRKKNKKNMTDRALELMLKKLDGMASDDLTKQKILNQSIENCWQGIFELKGGEVVKEQPVTNNPFLQRKLERMAAEKIDEQRRDQ